MKFSSFLSNFLLTLVWVAIIISPFGLAASLYKVASSPTDSMGAVLSASDEQNFNRYLKINRADGRLNTLQAITAYAFPGQPAIYRQIFSLTNNSGEKGTFEVLPVAKDDESSAGAEINLYFGGPERMTRVELAPGETAVLDLEIDARNIPSRPPFPVEVQFLIKDF